MKIVTMHTALILLISILAHSHSAKDVTYCMSDSNCKNKEMCVYEQVCDESGCTQSSKKVCK
ncbi:MAG: hypothetical protein ACMG6E_04715 [Candidatus Roizmanbacteria bacterium]